MDSLIPPDPPQTIRHRIREITLEPKSSESPIKLEILVDDAVVHSLRTIERGRDLHWDVQTYPCDVNPSSKVGLRLTEKHRGPRDRTVLMEYFVPETANQTLLTRHGTFLARRPILGFSFNAPNPSEQDQLLALTVKFLNPGEIERNYLSALKTAAGMVEESSGPLDKIGKARNVIKPMLDIAVLLAKLNPIAKLVVGLCNQAWGYLEKLQKRYEDLKDLFDGLKGFAQFIESIKGHVQEVELEQAITALLHLIEDTSNLIINSATGTVIVQKIPGSISDIRKNFGQLKENFVTAIAAQGAKQTFIAAQRKSIGRLEPANGANYGDTDQCQSDTRTKILEEIYAWARDPNTPSKLLWLYGQAGMGKSAIASSICRTLHQQGTLGASFFCKYDQVELSSPARVLNTLLYQLARKYNPYCQAVARAIEDDHQLPTSALEQRYMRLIVGPLKTLKPEVITPSTPLLLVVDALDECKKDSNRQLLLAYLREMPRLVPWIKVLVTGRPDPDIKTAFESSEKDPVDWRDLLGYDASDDIFKFTQERMCGIAAEERWPSWEEESIRLLSTRANGLFIWAETACRFIKGGSDPSVLNQVLEDTTPTDVSKPLDLIYTTAITRSMGNLDEGNIRNFRECLGAIIATASRTPLPVAGLESLLSSHAKPYAIRTVVNRLGSLLYEDQSRNGAVRVYHPSFSDYILNPARSKDFYTDHIEQNATLAACCLQTMMRELRFNICELETSHVRNCDVSGWENRVQSAIGRHLAYSCMHWIDHLTKTLGGAQRDQLGEFLYSPQLLYWIEAMSLLGRLGMALSNLLELIEWAVKAMKDHSSYANDAYRFILTFYDAISESAPHLYISALPLAPKGSKFAQKMRVQFPKTLLVTIGTNESWPSWLQIMNHNSEVRSIACSADGRRIVSGSCGLSYWDHDGMVQIWDSETGAAVSEKLESPNVGHVAMTSDGRRIASGSKFGTLRLWNAETGTLVCEPFGRGADQQIWLESIAFSPDDRRLYSIHEEGTAQVWDAESGTPLSEFSLEVFRLTSPTALSPDGRHISSGTWDGSVQVWIAETGSPVTQPLIGHLNSVNCVAFSPNGRLVASGSDDTTVRLWDISTSTAIRQLMIGHSDSVRSIAFSPDGLYLVSGSVDKTVRVWNVSTGIPVCEPLVGHTASVNSVAFCSNGRRIASASDDKTMRIWDVEVDFTASEAPLGHSSYVNCATFSPNSQYLASGDEDGTVRIWDVHTSAEAFKPLRGSTYDYRSILFTADSRRIIELASDNLVQVWDLETGALVTNFPLGHSEMVLSIALSPNGRRIVSGSSDCTVGLWDATTGAAIFPPLAGHSDEVYSVSFSPDGHYIASGSGDDTVRIWDAETGAGVRRLAGRCDSIKSVCFSPDGRRIACGNRFGRARVWDTESGVALLTFDTETLHLVVFSHDGRHIFSSGVAEVQVHDAQTGAAVTSVPCGGSGRVACIAASPCGRYIASGSSDHVLRIWDAKTVFDPKLLIAALHSAPSTLSLSTGFLASYANKSGWVTSSDGALLLWLPKDRRHPDSSVIQISPDPSQPTTLLLDFSKFVHGSSWASVASA